VKRAILAQLATDASRADTLRVKRSVRPSSNLAGVLITPLAIRGAAMEVGSPLVFPQGPRRRQPRRLTKLRVNLETMMDP
jgi:hypothetical protein